MKRRAFLGSALGAVGIGAYMHTKANSDKNFASIRVKEISNAIQRYQFDVGTLPETGEAGLQALITKPTDEKVAAKWGGPYVTDSNTLKDPWNNSVKYEVVKDEAGVDVAHVWSMGPDGNDNTEDDIRSWSAPQ